MLLLVPWWGESRVNGLGQLTNEYQSHSGTVNVLTAPQVQYGYTQMAGGVNNSRLVSMTYPNGRVLNYNYATGVANAVSRLTSLSDNSGTLEQYKYLGLGAVVERNHPLPGLDLTYLKQTGEANGDAGDQYTGLDRFGRVADQRWILTGTGTADGTATARTNNQHNQATLVGTSALTYDANGNLTTDEQGQAYLYDAWNRLVQVKSSSGTVLAANSYDGLGRRIQETSAGVTMDLYYSAQGKVLEEQVGGKASAQFVWSAAGVNILVERDRDPTGSGTLSERLWVMQDANGNVTGLVNNSGQVVERYVYDPFGAVTVLDGSYNTLSGSAYASRYLSQGMRLDPATGKYHTGARDYRPMLYAWLEQVPIGFASATTNLRAFVANGPVGASDPSGLKLYREPTVQGYTPSQFSTLSPDGQERLLQRERLEIAQYRTPGAAFERQNTLAAYLILRRLGTLEPLERALARRALLKPPVARLCRPRRHRMHQG